MLMLDISKLSDRSTCGFLLPATLTGPAGEVLLNQNTTGKLIRQAP